MGRLVRIPLGGRRVRGFVIEVEPNRRSSTKDILAVSGGQPIFDAALLQSLRWASNYYVAPLSVVLEKAAPPTLPAEPRKPFRRAPGPDSSGFGEIDFTRSVAVGTRRPALAWVGSWRDPDWLESVRPVIDAGMNVLAIVPTVDEAGQVAGLARGLYGDSVVLIPEDPGSAVTRAWEESSSGSRLVIGTPRVAAWHIESLGLVAVVEEGRRAMKDRQTPTIHVRDLIRTRSRFEGFGAMFVGPTPSVELIAAGAEVHRASRPWGLVEVVDRSDDPPGGGFISERTVTAIKSVLAARGKTFVFTHRRASDASVRCASCRALRRCQKCGSHVGNHLSCRRCGTEAARCAHCGANRFESMGSIPSRLITELGVRIDAESVGEFESDRPVVVGTERDLAHVGGFDLAVAVDVDALLFGHNYRASEEALRIVARVVGSVRRGQGFRAILQTSAPGSELIAALRRGDPVPYLESVLADRARNGFPPVTEMVAIEVRNDQADLAPSLLEEVAGSTILGSVTSDIGTRWLIQGDLRSVKSELRSAVQKMRDANVTVRVDVDPIDL